MQGLEYMVSQDPSDNDQKLENSGVWVIRKQIRRKRQGMDDEITPISSYFIVGENIYMAPSVDNVLGSRMVWAKVPRLGAYWAYQDYLAFNCHIPYRVVFRSLYSSPVYALYGTYLLPSDLQESHT